MAEKGQKDGVKAALLPPDLLGYGQLHFLFVSQSPLCVRAELLIPMRLGKTPVPGPLLLLPNLAAAL